MPGCFRCPCYRQVLLSLPMVVGETLFYALQLSVCTLQLVTCRAIADLLLIEYGSVFVMLVVNARERGHGTIFGPPPPPACL